MNNEGRRGSSESRAKVIVGDGDMTLEDLMAVAFEGTTGAAVGGSTVASQVTGGPCGH